LDLVRPGQCPWPALVVVYGEVVIRNLHGNLADLAWIKTHHLERLQLGWRLARLGRKGDVQLRYCFPASRTDISHHRCRRRFRQRASDPRPSSPRHALHGAPVRCPSPAQGSHSCQRRGLPCRAQNRNDVPVPDRSSAPPPELMGTPLHPGARVRRSVRRSSRRVRSPQR
jgi:hypothetical protein